LTKQQAEVLTRLFLPKSYSCVLVSKGRKNVKGYYYFQNQRERAQSGSNENVGTNKRANKKVTFV